ncbi:hypothetical protein ACH49_24245 [Streptomyces leeuwenhoekii]|uniref:Uncharacterized protein n=1 Tax=Streptomyces leeuwenhoekii TaxID=1437453 RepID=A0ABR5HT72_STRLW|nr:hypothetical protein [Streptomyces leeuwenhoekii]KMS71744.1 hypothetical protein ACH49_24245 [Streptomyces leeuwenhoekii]
MPKIKFSAFATNAKTGERGHGTGETTVGSHVDSKWHREAVRQSLARQGYKDVAVDDIRVED